VLLDMKMPRLDGLGVLRELKSADLTRSIPVVVMSSSSEERDLAEAYRLGVNGYTVKPLEFGDMLAAVARIGMYWLILNLVPARRQASIAG
jgi:CheY-like chemotaxis protein